MELVKRNSKKIVVGYDLGDTYAQISYCMLNGNEPETLAVVTGTEQYNIPAVLCKRNEVNQWFYGKEAIKFAKENEGTLVNNLVALAREGSPVEVGGESFEPVALLTLFIKRSMSLLAMTAPPDYLEGIMFTIDNLDKRMVEVLSQVAANLQLKTDKVFFQSHMESFYYHTLYQEEALWAYEVMLCDYDNRRLKIYGLDSNKKTTPIVMYIEQSEYSDLLREQSAESDGLQDMEMHKLDMRFLEILRERFKGKTVSCVYLIGEGYKDEWMKESLKFLCMGRRVFAGNNLYSRGACYGIKEKLGLGDAGKGYAFLGPDKLKANIGMKALRRGLDSYYAVLDAGVSWYEAKAEYDVILEEENSISIILTPLNGKEPREINMILEGLPERPKRTTRLHIGIGLIAENQISIHVKDMGFGEIFPASGGEWRKVFDI